VRGLEWRLGRLGYRVGSASESPEAVPAQLQRLADRRLEPHRSEVIVVRCDATIVSASFLWSPLIGKCPRLASPSIRRRSWRVSKPFLRSPDLDRSLESRPVSRHTS
jgi:hypothetical protein